MTGWRDDAVRLMSAIDIFVMPSYVETFGNALVEAMALGKPVVASDVGGMSEILSSPSCGRLVPPGDPDALARGLEALIRDPELRKRLGEAGRRHVEKNYSLEKNASRIKHFYMELVFGRSRNLPEGLVSAYV
jgi:glycosyltransferase involved in cell wall biosynthesis